MLFVYLNRERVAEIIQPQHADTLVLIYNDDEKINFIALGNPEKIIYLEIPRRKDFALVEAKLVAKHDLVRLLVEVVEHVVVGVAKP